MKKIAIVAGGDSGEYQISMKSGQQVFRQTDRSLFEPWLIEIKGDQWFCLTDDHRIPVNKNDFSVEVDGVVIRFDAVFNAIHGTPGENGKLQGYLDMLHIPYTSCDHTTSALTFNKAFCKSVVVSNGFLTAPSVHLFASQRPNAMQLLEEISYPCFVKPNCGGSSVGMSKVNHAAELPAALDLAFAEDTEVLVEEFVKGRELTCAVMHSEGHVITLPVCEIVTKKEFFDYEAKYTPGLTDEIVPAHIPEEVSLECQRISAFLYKRLNCKGIIRVDYIFSENDFYFLEINTVPGLTEASIVPKMIAAHGWSYPEMVTRLLQETLRNDSFQH